MPNSSTPLNGLDFMHMENFVEICQFLLKLHQFVYYKVGYFLLYLLISSHLFTQNRNIRFTSTMRNRNSWQVREKLFEEGNIWITLLTVLRTLLLIVQIVNYLIVLRSTHNIILHRQLHWTAIPHLATLAMLKKSELILLATHYKLDILTGTRKVYATKSIASY